MRKLHGTFLHLLAKSSNYFVIVITFHRILIIMFNFCAFSDKILILEHLQCDYDLAYNEFKTLLSHLTNCGIIDQTLLDSLGTEYFISNVQVCLLTTSRGRKVSCEIESDKNNIRIYFNIASDPRYIQK